MPRRGGGAAGGWSDRRGTSALDTFGSPTTHERIEAWNACRIAGWTFRATSAEGGQRSGGRRVGLDDSSI